MAAAAVTFAVADPRESSSSSSFRSAATMTSTTNSKAPPVSKPVEVEVEVVPRAPTPAPYEADVVDPYGSRSGTRATRMDEEMASSSSSSSSSTQPSQQHQYWSQEQQQQQFWSRPTGLRVNNYVEHSEESHDRINPVEGSSLAPEVLFDDDDDDVSYPSSSDEQVGGKSNFPKSWSKGLSGAMARTLDH
jgi:hypothetical protein